jgi:hypothetical protein
MSEAGVTPPKGARGLVVVVGDRSGPPREEGVARDDSACGAVVSFDRRELRVIFDLYGAKVASGEWRDYAIDFSATRAAFSIFRRTSETPLFRIEKNPELARRQGAYSVIAATGLIMRRGHDLKRVIGVLDRRLQLVPAAE